MTEKDKMIRGEMYSPTDEELIHDRKHARKLTHELNNLNVEDESKRSIIYKTLFGKVGNNLTIESPFHCDYGYNIYWGEDVFVNFGCVILDVTSVIIGNNVMIATNVQILTATHPLEAAVRNAGLEYAKPIIIGDNVWLGGGAIINPGVTIGDNSVIGSGSVVVKDIPKNVLAAGNPCRVIKDIDQGT